MAVGEDGLGVPDGIAVGVGEIARGNGDLLVARADVFGLFAGDF